MGPFFSVCIPVYNGERFLKGCLESIANQTFKDFEIIVVDDGSSDNSVSIIKEFKRRDSRLLLYQNERNLGLVGNWNRCIEKANGEWIKFLFQDDYWEPECLQEVALRTEGNVFVFHARQFLISDNAEISLKTFYNSTKVTENPGLVGQSVLTPQKICELIIQEPDFNFIGEPSCVCFKKSVVSEVGYFNTRLIQLCDYEYWCRIASKYGAFYIPKKLLVFRVHDESASSSNLETKKFRYHYIDPLILINEFRSSHFYALLRTVQNAHSVLQKRYDHLIDDILYLVFSQRRSKGKLVQEVLTYAPFIWKKLLWFQCKIRIKRVLNA